MTFNVSFCMCVCVFRYATMWSVRHNSVFFVSPKLVIDVIDLMCCFPVGGEFCCFVCDEFDQ